MEVKSDQQQKIEEKIRLLELEKWHRRDQWLIDLDLQARKNAVEVAITITKILGFLSGAAILILIQNLESHKFLDIKSAAISAIIYTVILGFIAVLGLIIYYVQSALVGVTSAELKKPIIKDEETKNLCVELTNKSSRFSRPHDRLIKLGEVLAYLIIITFFSVTFWTIHNVIIFLSV